VPFLQLVCESLTGNTSRYAPRAQRLNEGADEWSTQQYEAELGILCKIAHPHICRLYAFSTDGPNRCLVMELCTGGALDDRLARKAPGGNAIPPALEWQHRVQIALDVGLALEHLHTRDPPQIHRYAGA
jgi:serine/threonine protein kinase